MDDPMSFAAVISQNIVMALGGKSELQTHELTLYMQACRTLQNHLQFVELQLEKVNANLIAGDYDVAAGNPD
jgi:hypothetical protein